MRRLILAAALFAAPAAAQPAPYDPDWVAREAELRAQQDMLRNRTIGLQNQMTAMEMRLQTERAERQLELQRQRPAIPAPIERAGAPASRADLGGFTSIPDSRLDASNARVRAASRGSR
jgi:hypothetical protein